MPKLSEKYRAIAPHNLPPAHVGKLFSEDSYETTPHIFQALRNQFYSC